MKVLFCKYFLHCDEGEGCDSSTSVIISNIEQMVQRFCLNYFVIILRNLLVWNVQNLTRNNCLLYVSLISNRNTYALAQHPVKRNQFNLMMLNFHMRSKVRCFFVCLGNSFYIFLKYRWMQWEKWTALVKKSIRICPIDCKDNISSAFKFSEAPCSFSRISSDNSSVTYCEQYLLEQETKVNLSWIKENINCMQ